MRQRGKDWPLIGIAATFIFVFVWTVACNIPARTSAHIEDTLRERSFTGVTSERTHYSPIRMTVREGMCDFPASYSYKSGSYIIYTPQEAGLKPFVLNNPTRRELLTSPEVDATVRERCFCQLPS